MLGADWGVHTLLTATAVDNATNNRQPFFLDTGGFDGRQARTRRQIDQLKQKGATYEHERDALPPITPNASGSIRSLRCCVAKWIGVGANMSSAIVRWPI